jgi:hypothetical protein
MRRSAVLSRLFIAFTTASLVAGMLVSAAPVLGKDETRFERFQTNTGKIHTRQGSRGHVNPRDVAKHPKKDRTQPTKLDIPKPKLNKTETSSTNPAAVASAPEERSTTANPPAALPGVSGINQNGPYSNGEPPDPWVAAGPEHVIQTTNLALRILDRSGNTVVDDFSIADFFQLPNGFGNSDPRVHFDSLHQRWLMTELSWTCDDGDGIPVGYIDLLVSDSADPLGEWTLWYFGFEFYLPDYPAIGTSTNTLAFGANFFEMDTGCVFLGDNDATGYVIFDWADVLANGARGEPDYLDNVGLFAPLGVYATPRVALQTPATSPALHTVIQVAGTSAWEPDYLTFTGKVLDESLDVGSRG